jgi:hypothetical protein
MTNFQPAKTSEAEAPVFTNCGKADRAPRKQKRARREQKVTRVAFRISRLMEFCTKRELQNQTGHSVYEWPLVAPKEIMDNALDACEEAETAPVISVNVTIPIPGRALSRTAVARPGTNEIPYRPRARAASAGRPPDRHGSWQDDCGADERVPVPVSPGNEPDSVSGSPTSSMPQVTIGGSCVTFF